MKVAASLTLGKELAEFASLAACAGIFNSPKQARKARGNHYGEFETDEGKTYQVPVRQYVWAATRDRAGKDYGQEIKNLITKGIHDNPTPHTQKTLVRYEWGERVGTEYLKGTGKHGTPVFAGRNGYRGLLNKIAKQMEINQFHAIEQVNIIGKKHNEPSTIARKKKDHPLVDTGKMQMAITSRVVKQ